MSDFYIRIIPENTDLNISHIDESFIENVSWNGYHPRLIIKDRLHFADAGQNFHTVKCPFCDLELNDWWINAMNSAYSDEYGFTKLESIVPCCNRLTSLHDLNYNYPQGFYRVMIEIDHTTNGMFDAVKISDELRKKTNEEWRIIYAHY